MLGGLYENAKRAYGRIEDDISLDSFEPLLCPLSRICRSCVLADALGSKDTFLYDDGFRMDFGVASCLGSSTSSPKVSLGVAPSFSMG